MSKVIFEINEYISENNQILQKLNKLINTNISDIYQQTKNIVHSLQKKLNNSEDEDNIKTRFFSKSKASDPNMEPFLKLRDTLKTVNKTVAKCRKKNKKNVVDASLCVQTELKLYIDTLEGDKNNYCSAVINKGIKSTCNNTYDKAIKALTNYYDNLTNNLGKIGF